MAKKKSSKQEQAEVHEELKGFNIRIDPFGKLESNIGIDKLKSFLDSKLDDKKMQHLKSSEEE